MTNHSSRLSVGWPAATALAILLLALGAAGAYLFTRTGGAASSTAPAPVSAVAPPGAPGPAAASAINQTLPDITLTLSADAVARAGITVTPSESRDVVDALRLPATIQPNEYRQVEVTAVAAGRVTRVPVNLGEHVKQGQLLAQIFSPELAEAQTQYAAERAALDAHEKAVARTEKLAEIGAASRQELERVRAEHTERVARLESVSARLVLLGRPRSTFANIDAHAAVDAAMNVSAPLSGVVTARAANVGVNVDTTTKLFTVVDLSNVWVVASVFEKDLSRVRVGDDAVVATAAFPGRTFKGRVTYIDPQVNAETRTAGVRVEVANPNQDLKLGMLAEAQVAHPARTKAATWVSNTAIQLRGDRTVVYVAASSPAGQFTEREVRLGRRDGDRTEVIAGVEPGDPVVSEGSFFLRAEVDRQGLRSVASSATSTPMAAAQAPDRQSARIVVNEKGFEPSEITFREKVPATIRFIRVSENTCATEVLIESLKIRRELPLNNPVDIEFTPTVSGTVAFSCGMNMFRGALVVR